MGKRVSRRQGAIELLEGAEGWEGGKTAAEIALELYGNDDCLYRHKARMIVRSIKPYFLSKGQLLGSVNKGREFRYCLTKTSNEAFSVQNILIFLISRNADSYILQDRIARLQLEPAQRRQLLDAIFNTLKSLTYPEVVNENKA